MIKFLIDNNVPKSVAVFLKKKRYNVKLVKTVDPEMQDLEVIGLAKKENRIIVSNDKDFLSLAVKYSDINMIIFDFIDQKSEVRITALKKVLPHLKSNFGVFVLQ